MDDHIKKMQDISIPISIFVSSIYLSIYTVEYYSAIKKNEVMSLVGKWMEPEGIMLSEINQNQKDKCCIFSPIGGI
jgi:hypothetical protein